MVGWFHSLGIVIISRRHTRVPLILCAVSFLPPVPHSGSSLMNLFWRFFVTSLTQPGIPDYVLRVYHSKFFVLPWARFYPTLPNMELMLEVRLWFLVLHQLPCVPSSIIRTFSWQWRCTPFSSVLVLAVVVVVAFHCPCFVSLGKGNRRRRGNTRGIDGESS